MEKILEQFGINPWLLAAQIVNFFILLFILKKLLYKPILKMLEERKEHIAQSLKNAEKIERKLLEIEEEEEKRLIKAGMDAEKLIKEAKISALELIEEGKMKAQDVAESIVAEARGQLQVEREKLNQEVREHLAELIGLSLQKVTGKILDKKGQKDIISKTIKDL